MRVGVISFSAFSTVVDLVVKGFLPNLLNEHEVTGIKVNQEGEITINEFHPQDIRYYTSEYRPKKIQLSYPLINEGLKNTLRNFDKLILFGNGKSYKILKKLKNEIEAEILFIPVSIHNDIEGSDTTVGYDTVINSIAQMTFKIQDTIDSLKYPNPRLFGVQIPGSTSIDMLDEVARITGGHYLPVDFDEKDVRKLIKDLDLTFSRGQTYSFLIFNEDLNEERIEKEVLPALDVNWKTIVIDGALCMGPNPTALDRLLASKLAEQVPEWIRCQLNTGELLVKSREVVYYENEK
jgi:6-phosphofructokinase 1